MHIPPPRAWPKPSPSMVVSLTALFIALGGVGYAATLAPNSAGTKELKASSVTAVKIRHAAVTSRKTTTAANVNTVIVRVFDLTGSLADSADFSDGVHLAVAC